ncbi:MAG TPA: c-type cytochrome [Flavitalea sp.]|nr:c-type cytochrome [Flavitalea sp.]
MKKFLIISSLIIFVFACSNPDANNDAAAGSTSSSTNAKGNPSYDPDRGEGKFKDVQISEKLDEEKAARGEKVSELKCLSCHKLSDERLVGPGWKGTTVRHRADWLLNFMTNTDAMIDKDPKVQAMLEICMVRMPNQNLTDDEAFEIYEFMRKNDGVE